MSAPGNQLRDYEELQGTLLPTATVVEPSAPLEDDLPTAQEFPTTNQRNNQRVEEAPFIPPAPSDDRYRMEGQHTLARAQQQGRLAAYTERNNVMRLNQTVPAYNNQAELEVDRANQVARIENYRERQLVNPPIATPPLETARPKKKTQQQQESTPPTNNREGYQVQEYDIGEYDGGYSYEISEYKSDYDF